ncbi:MAG: DUF805 domain-containing protein [Pseudomonadota bacterium]
MLGFILKPIGTFFWVFFGLEGRITRLQWLIGMAVIWVTCYWLRHEIAHYAEYEIGLYPNPTLMERIELIALLILIYPTLALCQKRLHDRDWGIGGIIVLSFLPYAGVLTAQSGLLSPLDARDGLAVVLHYAVFTISAIAVVEMGVLPGVSGSNSHGPDPLAPEIDVVAEDTPRPIQAAMVRSQAAQIRSKEGFTPRLRDGLSPSPTEPRLLAPVLSLRDRILAPR